MARDTTSCVEPRALATVRAAVTKGPLLHLRDELADAAKTGSRAGYRNVEFHPSAFVHKSAIIFAGAWIGPKVVIEEDCVIGPGVVIGAPGFGYTKQSECGPCDGEDPNCAECGGAFTWQYRSHTAGVIIERDVHIGANSNVAQGRHRPTIIREGARVDALSHLGHNCDVGRGALVVALSMLGGTSTVGDGGYVASATVRDHVDIGAGSMAGLGSVVVRDIPDGETWAGVPARKIESKSS